MILCVDTRKLNTAPHVQKDLKLADIVLNHTKYYDTAADAEKERYVPLDFAVSVRTVYTNKVLQIRDNTKDHEGHDQFSYYVNHTKVGQFVHKGYDLIMYLSAIGLMSFVEYSYAFDEMMLKHSVLQPVGLYNPDHGFFNPIVYSHIIIADEAEDTLKTFLKPEAELVTLDHMRATKKSGYSPSISAMLDTLITVEKKGEQK